MTARRFVRSPWMFVLWMVVWMGVEYWMGWAS